MHLPDALGIFAHGAVGGENAAAGNVDERQTRARGGVRDRRIQPLMRSGVIIKVGGLYLVLPAQDPSVKQVLILEDESVIVFRHVLFMTNFT